MIRPHLKFAIASLPMVQVLQRLVGNPRYLQLHASASREFQGICVTTPLFFGCLFYGHCSFVRESPTTCVFEFCDQLRCSCSWGKPSENVSKYLNDNRVKHMEAQVPCLTISRKWFDHCGCSLIDNTILIEPSTVNAGMPNPTLIHQANKEEFHKIRKCKQCAEPSCASNVGALKSR